MPRSAEHSTGNETLDVRTRAAWRQWLARHHESESVIWLVFHKRGTRVEGLTYEDAVQEALCFGWIDSLVKRLDDATYARKFTPRTRNSRWSTINRKRYALLKRRGLLAPAGAACAPTSRSGDAPRVSTDVVPTSLLERLEQNAAARKHFDALAPSYRKLFILWIAAAKREATRQRRIDEAIKLLAAGKKLGLK